MKLLFKQRFFSWFDSYDIYDERGNVYYSVKGQLAWGHLFYIFDRYGNRVGAVKQQLFRFLPHFSLYVGDRKIGEIVKEFTFLKPKFRLNCNGWEVEGDFMQWDYNILSPSGAVATLSKQLFNLTDTYVLDILREEDALSVLMVALAIDAVKCSDGN